MRKRGSRIKKAPVSAPPGRALGLDVSSTCVGWAVFDDGQLTTYGKYVQIGEGHGEKLVRFTQWLGDLLETHQPRYLLIEAPFAGRKRFAFGVLMMYFGAVLAEYVRWAGHELPASQRVAAHSIKRLLGAKKGQTYAERKRLMVLMINQIYALNLKYKANDTTKRVSEDDIADAIALVRAWLLRGEYD